METISFASKRRRLTNSQRILIRSERLDRRGSNLEAFYESFIYSCLADRSHSIHLHDARPNSPRLPRARRKLSGSGSFLLPRLDLHNRLLGANKGRLLGSGRWERTHDMPVEGGISVRLVIIDCLDQEASFLWEERF